MIKKLLIISMIIVAKSSFGQYIYQLRAMPVVNMDGDVIIYKLDIDCFPNKADSLMFYQKTKKLIYEIHKINIKTKESTILNKPEEPYQSDKNN
jgi:hypothetical protein